MSLSLHAYLVSLVVTDRQLDTSKTERGGRTKSNGDQSCIVTSVSLEGQSFPRKRESGGEERHLLSDRVRGQFIVPNILQHSDVSDKDIECSVKCAISQLDPT